MAIISKKTVQFEDITYKQVINYSPRSQKFSITVPPQLSRMFGVSVVEGNTEIDAKDKLYTLINEYRARQAIKEKVILVLVKTEGSFKYINDAGEEKFFRNGSFIKGNEVKIDFDYEIAYKTEYNGEIKYVNENGQHVDEYGRVVIPWTEQRERFFEELRNSFRKFIVLMNEYFSEDDLNLTKKIDSGWLLLPVGKDAN